MFSRLCTQIYASSTGWSMRSRQIDKDKELPIFTPMLSFAVELRFQLGTVMRFLFARGPAYQGSRRTGWRVRAHKLGSDGRMRGTDVLDIDGEEIVLRSHGAFSPLLEEPNFMLNRFSAQIVRPT